MSEIELTFIDEDGKFYDISVNLDYGRLCIDRYESESIYQSRFSYTNTAEIAYWSDFIIENNQIMKSVSYGNDFPIFPDLKDFIERALKMKAFL